MPNNYSTPPSQYHTTTTTTPPPQHHNTTAAHSTPLTKTRLTYAVDQDSLYNQMLTLIKIIDDNYVCMYECVELGTKES